MSISKIDKLTDSLVVSQYELGKYLELGDFSYDIPEPDYDTLHDALINSSKNDTEKYKLCNYTLLITSSIIDAYICHENEDKVNNYIIIVIKTKDNCLSSDYWNLFYAFKYNFINLEKYFSGKLLINNSFYEDVKNKISSLKSQYNSYSFYGVGQGEGGAILDDLVINGMLVKSISLNPLIESKNFKNRSYNSKLYYSSDSPYTKTFARLCELTNIFESKPSIDEIDPRLVYINTKPTLISNATDNPTFYRGPGFSNWSSIGITFTGKYQIASNLYGELYFSNNFGQTWTRKFSKYYYHNDSYTKLKCSKVKMGWSSGKALFLRQDELYMSNDYGNTWSRVSEVVINVNMVEDVQMHISFDMLRLMVCVPFNVLYISEDGGKTWFNFTKRRFVPGYLNSLQEQENAIKPYRDKDFAFTNVTDLDSPLPDWNGLKMIRMYETYIWKPRETYSGGWVYFFDETNKNPILTLSDYRITNIQKDSAYDLFYLNNSASIWLNTSGEFIQEKGISFNIFPGPNIRRHILIPTSKSLYLSRDNGRTFKKCVYIGNSENNFNHNWTCTAMSTDGKFQIAAYNDDIDNNINSSFLDLIDKSAIIKSIDFGESWTYSQNPFGGLINSKRCNWTSLSISMSGEFITAVCDRVYSKSGLDNEGLIFVSFDGGITWKEKR
jgi:hypothetical protein